MEGDSHVCLKSMASLELLEYGFSTADREGIDRDELIIFVALFLISSFMYF